MSLKLRFLSWWTPNYFLKNGLDKLAHSTINGLEELLIEHDPKYREELKDFEYISNIRKGNLQDQRMKMATLHNRLVEKLIYVLGRDDAIKLGRRLMFIKGLSLGCEFREILGVGTSLKDLISAARILYKVLGIEFSIREFKQDKIVMVVKHCSLAEYYGPDTCLILSAADEGVVQGLNPKIKINFQKRITEGASCCLAPINFEDKR